MPGRVLDEENDDNATDVPHRAVVLCFDGTGNQFQGNSGDTNIIKLYQMLEKHTAGQYHYYQPGIGTYVRGQNKNLDGISNLIPRIRRWFNASVDSAIGTTFVDHVLGGYEFIMRYYQEHDDIYIFGFSRGAYTARFLAQMITKIGLLAKGNEEMVLFAWETFSKWQTVSGIPDEERTEKEKEVEIYMDKFRNTFCRPNIKIHFLGLFDCVNSVGQFEVPLFRKSYEYIAMPPAEHIRHAVSIHERRLKFKPALFFFSPQKRKQVDCKEVWFAGNHADIGGGWEAKAGQKHLLSDTPLNWMLQEVLNLPGQSELRFNMKEVDELKQAEDEYLKKPIEPESEEWKEQKVLNAPHDMLAPNRGVTWFTMLTWWILEVLPFFSRLELEHGKWVQRMWPPNLGAPRDIPDDALIDESVYKMHAAGILTDDEMPATGGDNSHFQHTIKLIRTISGQKQIVASTGQVASKTGGNGIIPDRTPQTSPLLDREKSGFDYMTAKAEVD